jgi:hypothetical protein
MIKAETEIVTTSGRVIRWGDIARFIPTSGAGLVYLTGEFEPVFVTRDALASAGIRQGC